MTSTHVMRRGELPGLVQIPEVTQSGQLGYLRPRRKPEILGFQSVWEFTLHSSPVHMLGRASEKGCKWEVTPVVSGTRWGLFSVEIKNSWARISFEPAMPDRRAQEKSQGGARGAFTCVLMC